MWRLARLREELRSRLWLIPALAVAATIVLSALTVRLDRWLQGTEVSVVLAFTGSAEAARTLLSVIASAMITLTALAFTILMVVLQLASSQFSPRVMRTFIRDRDSQYTLAVFVSTFTYALLVLREIRSVTENQPQFVPGVSVTVAFVLTILALGFFIHHINHIARGIRVTSIITSVAGETRRLIERLFPVPEEGQPMELYQEPEGSPALVVQASRSGVVTDYAPERLVGLARRVEGVIRLVPAVGDFVPEGGPLLEVYGTREEPDGAERLVSLEGERSMHRDVAFGFRQLVDIAEKALSPSINDPTTAVQAIDQIHDLLRRLATRPLPSGAHFDEEGELRLVVPVAGWDDYVSLACDEIRLYTGASIQAVRRLRAMLEDLATVAPSDRLPALERQVKLLDAMVQRTFPDLEDRTAAEEADPQGIGS